MEDDDKALRRLPSGALERNLRLTRLGVGAGTRIAAHTAINLFRSKAQRKEADRSFYQQQAQVLADELGRLKGSVMKAGQMLSLYGQYFLPPEAVRVLSGLQDNTQPVAWSVIRPLLEHALGRERLVALDVDPRPLAAASLGQVHRATRRPDGRALCLKIRYPGVAEAIESDVNTLYRIIVMTRLAPRGLSLEPIFDEVREMLHREVDYDAERQFTEAFAERLSDDARYVVPEVFGELSSERVLATSFEEGFHVRDAAVQTLSQARRDALGAAALELFLREFFVWRLVQTDPHFGNYRIRVREGAPDQLVLLDFGATRGFGVGFVEGYARIVRGALEHRRELVFAGARDIGLMEQDFPAPVLEAFAELCELIVEPFRGGVYDWGGSDLPRRVTEKMGRAALSRYFRIPPREIVFLHRRLAGVFILLATLRARLDGRDLLLRHLP